MFTNCGVYALLECNSLLQLVIVFLFYFSQKRKKLPVRPSDDELLPNTLLQSLGYTFHSIIFYLTFWN